jgi:5'(3')-deoxyribonucleotidase
MLVDKSDHEGVTMATITDEFVLGVDLDGVCADFYGRMREIFADWRGVPVETLTTEVTYGFPEWSILPGEYDSLHRFAVTQRDLFREMSPIAGAPQSLRRLGAEGVRIRVITHRLFLPYFHRIAVAKTVEWLDRQPIPYWDLCFMRDKALVDADLYVEDTDRNFCKLQDANRTVIAFTNSTNQNMDPPPKIRAVCWDQAEKIVREHYYRWREMHRLPLPTGPGQSPPSNEKE